LNDLIEIGIQSRHPVEDYSSYLPEYPDDSHESQWTRMMLSLKKSGTVFLPKKSISSIDPEIITNSRSSAGMLCDLTRQFRFLFSNLKNDFRGWDCGVEKYPSGSPLISANVCRQDEE
jgi:hypothetical protein